MPVRLQMNRRRVVLMLVTALSILIACGGGGAGGSAGGGGPVSGGGATVHFLVAGPAYVPSGTPFSVSVTALDASDNKLTGYSGTVHFTSSDPHAQLPPDSSLESGVKIFPATVATAGAQSITVTDKAVAADTGSGSVNVGALPGAFPVEIFGAKGDGKTDDTAAIKGAIDAAAAAGGGSVMFRVARYYTTGTFVVPAGVVLCGTVEGPFDVGGTSPAVTAVAPTLLVTNTGAPFLTLRGVGSGVTDVLFHYPNQSGASVAAPKVYPYTILVASSGTKVARSTVTNAYNFLDIEVGRTMAQNLYIGAFNIGVHIDRTYDFVTLHNLYSGVFWDAVDGATYPSAIDNWVLNHGMALVVMQMDALEVHDFHVYSRFAGILLTYSPDTTLPDTRTAWGTGSDIDLDAVQYGIIATATNGPGFEFTNVRVGAAPGLGKAAVQLRAGGTHPPDVIINGGSAQGNWSLGALPPPAAGRLTVVHMV
jgi:hypothetical protein